MAKLCKGDSGVKTLRRKTKMCVVGLMERTGEMNYFSHDKRH